MWTGTIAEIGGLMIMTAGTLQVIMSMRSVWQGPANAVELKRDLLAPFRSGASSAPADTTAPVQAWLGTRKFQVALRIYENDAQDTCSFYLVPVDGRPLPVFRPGQFLTFELPTGETGAPTVRCYSLSESPTENDCYRITVKKMPPPPGAPPGTPYGIGSGFLHDLVYEGDVLDVFAPAGSFCLDEESDRPVVLIAGGVGITPVLCMLNWLLETGSEREIWFFYGARNRQEHIMYDYLTQVRRNNPNVKMFVAYAEPTPECRRGVDYNVEGFIGVDLFREVLTASNYEFYMCGPPPMLNALRTGLSEWGVPEEDVHFESFGGAPAAPKSDISVSEPGTAPDEDDAIEVHFARSGKVVKWNKDAETLLELAEMNGLRVNSSCRAGNCGTCACGIREGSVEYVTPPARLPEAGTCLPCVSRAKSNLVLDL